MVDVGGHQLHLYCQGRSTPTVVLEAPATAMSAVWGWVQADVAKTTRVCSYDRAGLGWSGVSDAPFTPQAVAPELNALLAKAGEPAPFVMAGTEFGAALATLYAARYQDDTAALVLVNPPGAFSQNRAGSPSPEFVAFSPWLARTGLAPRHAGADRRAQASCRNPRPACFAPFSIDPITSRGPPASSRGGTTPSC